MKHRASWVALLLLLTLLLAACAGAATPASAPLATSTPRTEATPAPDTGSDEEAEPLAATPEPSPTEEIEMEASPVSGETAITELVLDHVSAETGIAREELTVAEIEAREWPNAGLGCPQPEQMYIEVITPGYLVQVQGGEERFNVHTNQDASLIVICPEAEAAAPTEAAVPTEAATSDSGDAPVVPAGGNPTPALSLPGEVAEVAARAMERVAAVTGLARSSLAVTSYSSETWPDSALGCRQPGQMYMQVITPGYKFVIGGGGETFNVHTDSSGNSVVICR